MKIQYKKICKTRADELENKSKLFDTRFFQPLNRRVDACACDTNIRRCYENEFLKKIL